MITQELPFPSLPDGSTEADANKLDISLFGLWDEICREVCDAEYANRTHGNRRTYDAGCKGPKCSKAQREHGRRRTSTNPSEKYQYLDPIIDAWYSLAAARYREVQSAMLEQVRTA